MVSNLLGRGARLALVWLVLLGRGQCTFVAHLALCVDYGYVKSKMARA